MDSVRQNCAANRDVNLHGKKGRWRMPARKLLPLSFLLMCTSWVVGQTVSEATEPLIDAGNWRTPQPSRNVRGQDSPSKPQDTTVPGATSPAPPTPATNTEPSTLKPKPPNGSGASSPCAYLPGTSQDSDQSQGAADGSTLGHDSSNPSSTRSTSADRQINQSDVSAATPQTDYPHKPCTPVTASGQGGRASLLR